MDLNEMRLPELWTLYAAAVGEESRCPNRRFLIRRITEARTAANGVAEGAAVTMGGAQAAYGGVKTQGQADAAGDALPGHDEAAEPAELLPSNGVDPDQVEAGLEYHTADGFGCEDDGEIAANDDALTTSAAPAATPDVDAIPDLDVASPELHAQKLTRLSVDELRLLYRQIIGRETGSTAKNYLIWKLREARKGRIKVGAIQRAPKPEAGAEKEMVVLPLRMPRFEVDELDRTWATLGFASRSAFLRRAITEYVGLRAVEG